MFKVSFFNSIQPSYQIPYDCLQFSGGELQIKLNYENHFSKAGDRYSEEYITINAHISTAQQIVELMLLTDALRRKFLDIRLKLILPYLPYARQDRVMNSGESLSIKVMCDIINSLKFETVEIADVHSDVSLALLNNVINKEQYEFVGKLAKNWLGTPYLVAPDAGAIKKTMKIAQKLNWPMVRADKTRNVTTGEISGSVVYTEHIGDHDFLMVDDIFDGGRSFLELAKVLRPLTNGRIYLYVTHGIFSKGLDICQGVIDHIYCAYPFPNVDLENPILTVLK